MAYRVKLKAMKTKLTFAIFFLLLNSLLFAGRDLTSSTSGNDTLVVTNTVNLPLPEEETYINDIPFDTKAIALKSLFANLAKPEEEAYINDIPFDTETIVAVYNFNLQNVFPEDEAYIDDIPFNTSEVAREYLIQENGFASSPEMENSND